MAAYKQRISSFCETNGIAIPPAFGRNNPSRYAIVRTHLNPPKLVAMTWFKVSDVIYFLKNHLQPELGDALDASVRILDFKTGEELAWNGASTLTKTGMFLAAEES